MGKLFSFMHHWRWCLQFNYTLKQVDLFFVLDQQKYLSELKGYPKLNYIVTIPAGG